MSTDNWIKFSEREPRPEDCPIWVATDRGNVVLIPDNTRLPSGGRGIHWQRAIRPAPPKEETQYEKDDAARLEAYRVLVPPYTYAQGGGWFREGWHAALRYERAEDLKLLNAGDLYALRKRCTP